MILLSNSKEFSLYVDYSDGLFMLKDKLEYVTFSRMSIFQVHPEWERTDFEIDETIDEVDYMMVYRLWRYGYSDRKII